MTKHKAKEKLRAYINKHYSSYGDFARDIGVSSSFVSQQLGGNGPISNTLLSIIKMHRVTTHSYRDIK